jgi:hypothetical protein
MQFREAADSPVYCVYVILAVSCSSPGESVQISGSGQESILGMKPENGTNTEIQLRRREISNREMFKTYSFLRTAKRKEK